MLSEPGASAIDRILTLIEEAEERRAPIERFIDRFSRIYTPVIMVIALLVTLIPPLMFDGGWQEWIYKGLTLLLIGCPCAGDLHARGHYLRAGGGGTARRID